MQERRKREREREWTWEPRHAVTGKSLPPPPPQEILGTRTYQASVRAPRLVAAESNIEGTEPDEKTEPRDARWIELWDEGREGGGGGGGGARKESGRG